MLGVPFYVQQYVVVYLVSYLSLDFRRIKYKQEELHLKQLVLFQNVSSKKKKNLTEGNGSKDDSENHSESSGEGSIIAVATKKEIFVSAEDVMCCICLGRYKDE